MENQMKKLILAAAIIAAGVGAAEAKCSKKSLNGNWMLNIAGQGVPVTISGGVMTVGTESLSFNLNDKCKGTGTYVSGGTSYPTTIATEKISASSSLKPNMIDVGIDTGMGVIVFSFYRR
jgi:hypothetical protein